MNPVLPKPLTRRSRLLTTALASGLALALAACGDGTSAPEVEDAAQAPAGMTDEGGYSTSNTAEADGPELGTFGIETDDMNPAVDPGDDFYAYVNGRWLDTFEIPAERSAYTRFSVLSERNEERIRTIIEDAAASNASAGSVEQKIGDAFNAFMDQEAIEAAGLGPVQAEFDVIDGIESRDEAALAYANPEIAAGGLFGLYVSVDAKDPDQYTVYLGQSGLGMPDRDYYLADRFADKAEAYRGYLMDMLAMAGVENPEEAAEEVYTFERRIAEVHWDRAKRRNRDLTYNPYTLEAMADEMPGVPWTDMLAELGVPADQEIIVQHPDAVEGIADIFAETDLETIKNQMRIAVLRDYASVLPSEIDDRVFAFYGTELSGQPQQRERWKRGVSSVSRSLGEAVGKVYVERHFPADSKAQMEELVANLRVAFAERLENLDWMSEDTKREAKAKLDAFTPKIGYPEEWEDYAGVEISEDDPVGNMRRIRVFETEDNFSQLGEPIDEKEWGMTPQTVNAYYSPTRNEIVFPAAILQAPFFDPEADPAVNYGAIGAVIGHEIGHGFDDQGRKSDGTGALRDWWTAQDAERFDEKAAKLGDQYATYEPVPGYAINPELTMGENIGDLGGLSMAYSAYRLSLGDEEAPVIDGFTGDQRFFMAWAQVWKSLYREEALKQQVATDSHSNGKYRVNGVVRNMDPWYQAFEVTQEDDLYLPPEERVSIW
jgi:predicted metalloendopeptidase